MTWHSVFGATVLSSQLPFPQIGCLTQQMDTRLRTFCTTLPCLNNKGEDAGLLAVGRVREAQPREDYAEWPFGRMLEGEKRSALP